MTYYKRLKVAILNDEFFVTVLLGNKEMAKKAMLCNYPDMDTEVFENTRGCYVCWHMQIPIIWIGLSPKDPHFYATVAHEAIHAIDFIFDEIGETAATEVYAHCVGAVVAKVEQWVKRKKMKHSKGK